MNDDLKTTSRRNVIAAAAVSAAGLAAAGSAAGQTTQSMQARPLNSDAGAVMPNGRVLDRSAVLSQLGLDPNTPPDAWLAIVNCGSNASALKAGDLRSLVRKGALKTGDLDDAARAKLGTSPR